MGAQRVCCVVALALVLVVCLHAGWAQGRVVEDNFNQHQTPLEFMAKFCYSDAGKGLMRFTPGSIKNETDLMLLTFDDTVWDEVYDKGLSCEKVRQIAQNSGRAAGMQPIMANHLLLTHFSDKTRPRYWYFAVSRCEKGPIDFKYTLEMLNHGDYWQEQFSYEDQGLAVLYLCYFLFYFIVAALVVAFLSLKWRNGTFGTVTQLFQLWVGVILLEMCSKFFMFIHEAIYADDGIGAPGVLGFGDVLEMCGRVLFVGLLMLMAKGYTLTTNYIHNKVLLICIFCVWSLSYVAFYIWENIEDEDISTNTTFESAPGIINLVLRGLIWVYFLFSIYQDIQRTDSISQEEQERARRSGEVLHGYSKEMKIRFHIPFAVLATIWFFMLPLMVIVSQGYASYYRFKTIMGVCYTLNFLIELLVGAWLYLPRDGLELTNGRGIFFGLLPSRFEQEHARLFGAPPSEGTFSGQQELQYLNKGTAQDNARVFSSPYDSL